jgi:ABC-type amino acid transport substrate-binding protein
MRPAVVILTAAFVAILAAYGTVKLIGSPQLRGENKKETTYERVIRTGTLRCGYWNWAPLFSVDMQNKHYDGIFYNLTNYLGEALGLKIEWTKEVGFASFEQDLLTDKVDAICAGVWPKAARGKVMEFTKPIFYVPLNIYVRNDDYRFDDNTALLNSQEYTFSGMDGLAEAAIVAQDFPNAKRVSLPDTASVSEIFLMVQDKKADAVVADVFTAGSYLKSHPGILRPLNAKTPFRYFGNTIAVKKGEHDLVTMLNTAIDEAASAGVVEKLVSHNEEIPNSLLRIAKPYETTP